MISVKYMRLVFSIMLVLFFAGCKNIVIPEKISKNPSETKKFQNLPISNNKKQQPIMSSSSIDQSKVKLTTFRNAPVEPSKNYNAEIQSISSLTLNVENIIAEDMKNETAPLLTKEDIINKVIVDPVPYLNLTNAKMTLYNGESIIPFKKTEYYETKIVGGNVIENGQLQFTVAFTVFDTDKNNVKNEHKKNEFNFIVPWYTLNDVCQYILNDNKLIRSVSDIQKTRGDSYSSEFYAKYIADLGENQAGYPTWNIFFDNQYLERYDKKYDSLLPKGEAGTDTEGRFKVDIVNFAVSDIIGSAFITYGIVAGGVDAILNGTATKNYSKDTKEIEQKGFKVITQSDLEKMLSLKVEKRLDRSTLGVYGTANKTEILVIDGKINSNSALFKTASKSAIVIKSAGDLFESKNTHQVVPLFDKKIFIKQLTLQSQGKVKPQNGKSQYEFIFTVSLLDATAGSSENTKDFEISTQYTLD